jgi:cation-transporting ATPase E
VTRLTGLTEAEAARRRAAGQGNDVTFAPSRSVRQIVRDNAFMSINVIVFAIGVALTLMGLFNDAILTVGLVLMNVLVAVVQEIRAKRALDRIALLSRMTSTVIRDGEERSIDPADIVLGDLLVASSGDQVMVDGHIVRNGSVALDESLLTGESDPVTRTVGDPVYSGSFVASGLMVYEADRVGLESRANQLTVQARVFQTSKTPVQREIDLVLRLMVVLIVVIGAPIVLDLIIRLLGLLTHALGGPFAQEMQRAYQGYSLQESVRAVAIIVGLLPQGLALMLTISYAMGAVRLAGQGALLQQANAVESLSHVDVVCFDKTGTITTNRLTYHDAQPLGGSSVDLAEALGDYAATTRSRNRTIEAIAVAYPGKHRAVQVEAPFSSRRKWSAITLDDDQTGTLVLGAPEVLMPALGDPLPEASQIATWTDDGLRVLLLARSPTALASPGGDDGWTLPMPLEPVGLVSFSDELQPDAGATFARFADAGVTVKIISGDHPETVAALTRQAGLGLGRRLDIVSGIDLAGASDAGFADAAERGEIFGRITPEQKLELVLHLQARGHYVAMVGDGVNDVLALKQAQVGIAMEHGSQATRAVADLVLLGDAVNVLPQAFREGQRIVRATQDTMKLFLTRSLSVVVPILGAGIIGAAFPILPTQNALPALLTVGIPAFALAAWTRPGKAPGQLLRNVLPFAIPASLSIGLAETFVYIGYLRITENVQLAQTMLMMIAVLCGLVIVLFVRPPTPWWTGGAPLSGDWKVPVLVALLVAMLVAGLTRDDLREFFALSSLAVADVVTVVLVVACWTLAIRYTWRNRVLQRLIGIAPVIEG